jgi:DNA sulfur modification protein DndC
VTSPEVKKIRDNSSWAKRRLNWIDIHQCMVRMADNSYRDIIDSLVQLYTADDRPWLVGFSGGKDSTMLASLIFNSVMAVPAAQRKKPVAVLCTDTRVEIPAIAEIVEGTLSRMYKFSQQKGLNIEVNLLKPPPEQSFWVNIITTH